MNEKMETSSQYKDLTDFLIKHNAKNFKDKEITHTRIGDNESIYGGSYVIPTEELSVFYKLYYEAIFVQKKKEYLTEKQLLNGGPIAVDFDFRYDYDVSKRQHDKNYIQDMVLVYLEELKEFFLFEENKSFNVFIFEKPHVNRVKEDEVTKDGIHMLIGLQADHTIQMWLREKMIEKIKEIWDLPIKNTWDKVLDDGISKGTTNWQLFGSRKPANEAYELTYHFVISYDKSDGEFMLNEERVSDFDLRKNFASLSVQNSNIPRFELNPKIVDEYNKRLQNKSGGARIKKPNSRTKMNLIVEDGEPEQESISLSDIKNKEILERAVNQMLKSLDRPDDYIVKETHYYAQILPEKYYEPGSHLLNRQVAFALKHTDNRLFLSWIMLRSKASDFEYDTIPKLYYDWNHYFNSKQEGVTRRSIMYWAKQDNYEEYIKVKNTTIDHYIEESLTPKPRDYDKANVLFQMFKDKFVNTGYKDTVWYVYKNHRWCEDKGLILRNAISTSLFDLYAAKRDALSNEYTQYDPNDERAEFIKKKQKLVSDVMDTLKQTTQKNNMMREAVELFYDPDFHKNLDANKNLLCFNNGVVDFTTKTFREGYPHDYISKSTNIDFKLYDPNDKQTKEIAEQVLDFMEKLFPVPQLNKYMWDHLASCLMGTNKNQTFNVYHGSGSNGKSMLVDLMSKTLGDYKGQVPITLITRERNSIGGTSSEVAQLKGIRYAVMQEPSKGMKLNEGVLKELTGGDPIQARGLWQDSETFIPQFKLVVCTNSLFEIESNDDGTWRRIRKCDFLSKFVNENDKNEYETSYIFKKDIKLEEKLPIFAPVFASMLVKRAFETEGWVEDCDIVLDASNKYRRNQDHIAAFVAERIIKTGNPKDKVGKRGLSEDFKHWFSQEQGGRRMPKGQELFDFMDKKFGPHKSTGWHGITFNQPENQDEIADLDY